MYHYNVPDQIIKETTGHRSECVRVYKRTSEELKQAASNTVNNGIVGPKAVSVEPMSDVLKVNLDDVEEKKEIPIVKPVVKSEVKSELSWKQIMHNVLKNCMELRKKMFPKSRLSLKRCRGQKGHY